ncbi:MAG: S9 family peptidase [Schleiferiaceae bacterium]|nr:S9 family peptidase [Schleiferiaceae bacterium]
MMRKFLGSMALLATLSAAAQSPVTFDDVFRSRTFSAKGVMGLRSMEDGLHYSRQTAAGIEKFDFATGESQGILVANGAAKAENGEALNLGSYDWTTGEKNILIEADREAIYRHSYTAKVYVYALATGKTTMVSPEAIQNPVLNPDGNRIAWVHENNVYYRSLEGNQPTRVTDDGLKNAIINGAPDWVYEEEFGFHVGLSWSPNGRYLAYYRFDERPVTEFSMDMYGTTLYPKPYVFKYPKAGEDNSIVSIWVYDTQTGQTVEATQSQTYEYIPRTHWSPKNELYLSLLNRHQDSLRLVSFDPETKKAKHAFLETDAAYTDADHNLTFLKDGRFVWMSDRSGFNHVYLIDPNKSKISSLTSGGFEVTELYGVDEVNGHIYYQAADVNPANRTVYRGSLKGGKAKALSGTDGWNGATFSTTFANYILNHSDGNTPARISLHDNKGKEIRVLEDNAELIARMKDYSLSPKTFFTLEATNGQRLPAWEIKPSNFDMSKKYPVLMFLYGGPASQQVTDNFGGRDYFWYQMLANEGYWIVCVDNRGTGGQGRDFTKCTYLQLGKYETEDQIAAANALGQRPNVDASRIGIWGWSYGGFMAAHCITQGADVFKAAISVAPVSNWRFYDNIYTERYMRTPAENTEGYDANSPLSHAGKLKGHYLLIHGTGDDNVHVQNSMRLAEELIQNNKDFDYMVYPDKNHGIYGGMTRIHLYSKMTKFWRENL